MRLPTQARTFYSCILFLLCCFSLLHSQTVEEIIDMEKEKIIAEIPLSPAHLHPTFQGSLHYLEEPQAQHHPFYLVNEWLVGTVISHNISFTEQSLKYDTYLDRLVWLNPSHPTDPIILNPSFVQAFQTGESLFIWLGNEETKGLTGYARLLFDGNVKLFQKFTAKISRSGDNPYGTYVQKASYYLQAGNTFFEIKSKKDLLDALPAQEADIKAYLKQKKVNVRGIQAPQFIELLNYLPSI
ncbi:MAG: hypothetical protein AAFY71_11145 [Bacteroidota bacterium]